MAINPEIAGKFEPRGCARCGKDHVCTLTVHCPCFDVVLSTKEMDYLSFHFDDCLCSSCLKEMQKKANETTNRHQSHPF